MSHLQYYAYEGAGVEKRQLFSYSQAVRIGDRIECAGQGKLIMISKLWPLAGSADPGAQQADGTPTASSRRRSMPRSI